MTFAEKLRELRDKAGISEMRLAQLSGVSFGAVHNYGQGVRRPTFAAVVKLARALGVTCEAFADCEDIAAEEEDRPIPPPPRPRGRPVKPKIETPAPKRPGKRK